MLKIETIVPRLLSDRIFDYLREEISTKYPNTALTERVDVLQKERFVAVEELTAR